MSIKKSTHTQRDHYSHHKILNGQRESLKNQKFGHSVESKLTMQNKNFTRNGEQVAEFSQTRRKPKMIHTRNSLVLVKDSEGLRWNHRKSTLHRPDTKWNCRNGSERSQRRRCIYLFCCSPESMKSGGQKTEECCCYLRIVQDLARWETST